MKTVYLNWRGPPGVETVDEFTQGKDSPEGRQEFRKDVREMVANYHDAGMAVYQSSRPCKNWNEAEMAARPEGVSNG